MTDIFTRNRPERAPSQISEADDLDHSFEAVACYSNADRAKNNRREIQPVMSAFECTNRKPSRKEARIQQIVDLLNKDARAALTDISRSLDIPTSTVFDYMKDIKKQYEFTIVRKGL